LALTRGEIYGQEVKGQRSMSLSLTRLRYTKYTQP